MDNNPQEPQDAINLEEDLDLDLNLSGDEDTEDLKTKVEEANKKLENFKNVVARAKKAEEELKKLKQQPQKPLPEKKDDDIRSSVEELKFAEKKRQFGYEHNLAPDEVDAIFKFNPNPTKEDLDNPFVKGGLEALKAKKRVESNTPSPSSKIFKVNGKSWGEMTPEEKEANWSKRQEYLKNH